MQNLKRSLEEVYTGVKLRPTVKEPVHLSNDKVSLIVPNDVAGWSIVPDKLPCEVCCFHQLPKLILTASLHVLMLILQFTRDEVDVPLHLSDYFSTCSYPPTIELRFICHNHDMSQEAQCILIVRGFVEGLSFPLLLSLPAQSHLQSPPVTSPKASPGIYTCHKLICLRRLWLL